MLKHEFGRLNWSLSRRRWVRHRYAFSRGPVLHGMTAAPPAVTPDESGGGASEERMVESLDGWQCGHQFPLQRMHV